MLVARPCLDQAAIVIFGKTAQEFEVVLRRAVVGQRQQQAGIGGFYRLMKEKGGVVFPTAADHNASKFKATHRALPLPFEMLPRDPERIGGATPISMISL